LKRQFKPFVYLNGGAIRPAAGFGQWKGGHGTRCMIPLAATSFLRFTARFPASPYCNDLTPFHNGRVVM
jgi:hypothetical protein